MKIGFFVNPLAGYGLASNRKGSDGLVLPSAGDSRSLDRAKQLLSEIKEIGVEIYSAGGMMGGNLLKELAFSPYRIIYEPDDPSSAADTREFVQALCGTDADLLVFVGGDGTARDILSSNFSGLPVVGVPAGVKMYSSVFCISVSSAAALIMDLASGTPWEKIKCDVVDIDEEKYRKGELDISLYGELFTPASQLIVSQSKLEYSHVKVEGVTEYLKEKIEMGGPFIIGPGSTCKSTIPGGDCGNMLGVDLVLDSKVVARDADEQAIYDFASAHESFIIVSPIGGQNFLFGRGNRQISARTVKSVGWNRIWVISSQEKLREMDNLYVDIGNSPDINIPAYIKVLYGYGRYRMVPVKY